MSSSRGEGREVSSVGESVVPAIALPAREGRGGGGEGRGGEGSYI